MMKIRYTLLLSVSCLGFGSIANAGITPLEGLHLASHTNTSEGVDYRTRLSNGVISLSFQDIRALVLHTTHHPHLCPQDKLLSDAAPASVIARRTSSDEAIHNKNKLAMSSSDKQVADLLDLTAAQGARSAILSPINPQQKIGSNGARLASVCFITDAGKCAGGEYGGANTPDGSSGGSSGGDDPEWELDNKERCHKEGYTLTSCSSSVQEPVNYCPYDNSYFEKCVCKPGLVTCTKPYYGVGESCGGKYASCRLDNTRACKEDGYTQTGSCSSVQNINKKCPYDANYFDKCVCRSDLYTCSSPLQGVGTACGGKYANCQCPSSYKSCDCGGAAGASSCTWSGTTKYSSCKSCCSSEYVYDSSNCAYPKKPSGAECGGKYTLCQGNCADAGYRDSIPSGQICNKISYADDMYQALKDADVLAILTEWQDFKKLDFEQTQNLMRHKKIVDCRNLLDVAEAKSYGFDYQGIGRK